MRIITLILILSLLVSLPISFGLQVSPTSIVIPGNTISYFNISFYNNGNQTLNITINNQLASIEYTALFSSIGANPNTFSLLPGQTQKVLFSFSTRDVYYSSPIQIQIPYTINGLSSSFTINAPIEAKNQSYLISVYSIFAPVAIYPYNPLTLSISILNSVGQTGIDVPLNFTLLMNGKVAYTKALTVQLNNLGLNYINETFKLNNLTPPGNYTFNVSSEYNNQVSYLTRDIQILPYTKLVVTRSSNINWLGGNSELYVTNYGNSPASLSNVVLNVSPLYRFFITEKLASSGNLTSVPSGFVSSLSSLPPGQTLYMVYSVSFIWVYILIIVVVILILIGLFLNRKVKLTKEVVEHRSAGGFIDIKIAIRVKNVTINKKPITNITISDFIPKAALKVSMLGPKEGKIEHVSGQPKLIWHEQQILPNDEIILLYEIKSRIGLMGSITLPSAECRFTYNNKTYVKHSNSLVLNIK